MGAVVSSKTLPLKVVRSTVEISDVADASGALGLVLGLGFSELVGLALGVVLGTGLETELGLGDVTEVGLALG